MQQLQFKHLNAPSQCSRIFNPSTGSAREEDIAIAMSWFSYNKLHILPSDFAAFASSNYSAKDSFSWGFDDSNNKLAPHRARPQVAATNLASEANYRGNKLSEPGSVFLNLFEITSASMLPISSANNVMSCPLV